MERVRPLTVALLLAAAAAGGCASVEKSVAAGYLQMKEAVGAAPPAPASQVLCVWQRKLTPLPDPTQDGRTVVGLVGQLFLITPGNQPAEVTGHLTIAMDDVTLRPPGILPKTREVFHYTPEVIRQLATQDERFGQSYSLYLIWPAEWTDVTTVTVNVRYDVQGQPTLYANETVLAVEAPGGPGNVVRMDGVNPATGRRTGDPQWVTTTTRGVPDPKRLVAGMPPQPQQSPTFVQVPPTTPGVVPQVPPQPVQPQPPAPGIAGLGPNAVNQYGRPNPAEAFPKPVLIDPQTGQPQAPPPTVTQPPPIPISRPVNRPEPGTIVIPRSGG